MQTDGAGRIDPIEFETYIDKILSNMEARPALYGPFVALEFTCLAYISMYARFCLDIDDFKQNTSYLKFRRTFFKKNLGPLGTADWLLGTEHGWTLSEHEMGQKLLGLMIAWKAMLKAEHGKV